MMSSLRSANLKVLAGLVTAMALVSSVFIVAYRNVSHSYNDEQEYQKIQANLEELEDVHMQLMQLDNYCRDFLMFRQQHYFQRYLDQEVVAKRRVNDYFSTNIPGSGYFPRVALIYSKLALDDELVRSTQRQQNFLAPDSGAIRKCELLNTVIYTELKAYAKLLQLNLDTQREEVLDKSKSTVKYLFLLLSFVFLVFLVIYLLFLRDVHDIRKRRDELYQKNLKLEDRIHIRTRALIDKEWMFNLVTKNIQDVVSIHNLDGSYRYVSDSIRMVGNYEPDALIGKSGYDFIHPDDRAVVAAKRDALFKEIVDDEPMVFRYLKSNGEYTLLEATATLVHDTAGKLVAFLLCSRDITNRKSLEVTLFKNRELLNILMESINGVMYLKDLDRKYLLVNSYFENILKKTPNYNGYLGKTDFDFFPMGYAMESDSSDQEILEKGEIMTFRREEPEEIGDGIHLVMKMPVKDETGKIYAIAGISTDITEYEREKEELLFSRLKFNAILENLLDPIFTVSKSYKLVDFNVAFKTYFGLILGKEVAAGASMLDLLNKKYAHWLKDNCERAFRGDYVQGEFHYTYNGELFYFDVSFNPIKTTAGINEVAVISRDVSENKLIQQKLNQKIEELNVFIYRATHDLRSPLVSLMGLVDIAKMDLDNHDEQLSVYFDMIGQSVSKMDKLLVDLVSIVRISQGPAQPIPIDFKELLDEIVSSIRPFDAEKQVKIEIQVEQTEPFYSDRNLILSILQNLIDNAIKYMNYSMPFPRVRVEVFQIKREVIIRVEDNGIGISKELQQKVFDIFYRATTLSTGTGLGLYLVKNSVEKLGGKISLVSELNEGTTFQLSLPMMQPKITNSQATIEFN